MKESQPWAVISDVEGPLKNGKYDGAKNLMETLVERKLMAQEEMDAATGKFDEHDDNNDRAQRFIWSHQKYPVLVERPRWSTGTLPGLAICYAARAGISQAEIFEMTRAGDVWTPGAKEFLIETKEKMPIHLLTSAEPSAALRLGEEIGIPSSRIYSMGYRPSPERLAEYDKNPNPEAEAEERSILNRLLPHRRKLELWLPSFVKNAVEWEAAFEASDTKGMKTLETERVDLFYGFIYQDKLSDLMADLFLKQNVLMGSHQKGEVVHERARSGRRVIYIGDSIVDTAPALYAGAWEGYGIATNSTNDDLNYAAGLLLATRDMRAMNVIRDVITEGRFVPSDMNHILGALPYGATLYTPIDLRNNPKAVLAEMRSCKNDVIALYQV